MHRNTVFQPPAARLQGQRFAPVGKHAKGHVPHKDRGQTQAGRQTLGAFGGKGLRNKAVKAEFLATSSQESKRVANERALKQAYAKWRESMTAEELAVARKLKVHFPAGANGEFGRPKKGQVEIDFHDPADLPEASHRHLPVDDLEPQSPFSVAIAALDNEEITAAADCFSSALTWTLDVKDQHDLVVLGMRAMVMIDILRPDLVGEFRRPHNWLAACAGFQARVSVDVGQAEATGEIFGRVLEWIRRGSMVSEIGERLCLVAYVVRPTMINSPTLEKLGETMNKTRQAKDKLVSCLRDTFAGLKTAAMRGERTRTVCQQAH